MSLYRYHCAKCHKDYHVNRKHPPTTPYRCPQCLNKTRRVFEVPNIQFRGKGFYSTDH